MMFDIRLVSVATSGNGIVYINGKKHHICPLSVYYSCVNESNLILSLSLCPCCSDLLNFILYMGITWQSCICISPRRFHYSDVRMQENKSEVQCISPQKSCAIFCTYCWGKQPMYFDRTLQEYLDDLAAAKSTPGGGSASAISGAMGAALASMVARFTLGKAEYADVQAEIEEIVQQTETLRSRFQELIQADIDAYGRLSAAYKLPRTTEEEREDRSKAIQAQLVEAALVPLEMAEVAAQVMHHCRRIAEIGNVNVLSDVATGAILASSAGAWAAWIVRTNLRSMKDLELVNVLSDRLHHALDEITLCSQQITGIVGSRA